MLNPDIVVILGPTASGKTRLAAQLAYRLGGEIISADSRQVYRGMDIGTGKDLGEYHINGQAIPYHLINICEAGQKYNIAAFQSDFTTSYTDIKRRGKLPILCGGSGLYIQSVLGDFWQVQIPKNEELRIDLEALTDDELLSKLSSQNDRVKTDVSTRKRIIRGIEMNQYLETHPGAAKQGQSIRPRIFGLDPDVDTRRKRISDRLRERIEEQNMIGEVKILLESGISSETLVYYGLEYKFITEYLTGLLDYNTMYSRLETAIHRFAKRQMTFFRSMEKKGFQIEWLDNGWSDSEKLEYIQTNLS